MVEFNYDKSNHFEDYDKKMVLKSNDKKTQLIFDKILTIFDKDKNNYLDADEIRTIWDNVKTADKDKDNVITEQEMAKLIKENATLSKLKISAKELLNVITVIDKTIDNSLAKTKANVQSQLMQKINTKYPSKKYSIETNENNEDYTHLVIRSKNNTDSIIQYYIFENGNYTIVENINQKQSSKSYDKNGKLLGYSKLNNETHTWEDGNPISDAIYKDITAKTKLGFATTGKDLEKHIMQITPKNVMQILSNYQQTYHESLYDAIDGEWMLDDKIKAKLYKHISKCVTSSETWKYNKPNTKIDEDFSQGSVGDCWFLASIAAIKRSPKGQKILNNMITDNKDGTYTVKFKGCDEKYTVTAFELMSKDTYSSGDIDVRILELAAEKHYNITGINGGNPATALELLLGTGDYWKNLARNYSSKPDPKEIKNLLKNKNIVMTASINPGSKLRGILLKSIPDNADYKDDIATAHGYAIVDIDNKNVYIKNPWYTEKTIPIPLDVFDEYWGAVQYTEIT